MARQRSIFIHDKKPLTTVGPQIENVGSMTSLPRVRKVGCVGSRQGLRTCCSHPGIASPQGKCALSGRRAPKSSHTPLARIGKGGTAEGRSLRSPDPTSPAPPSAPPALAPRPLPGRPARPLPAARKRTSRHRARRWRWRRRAGRGSRSARIALLCSCLGSAGCAARALLPGSTGRPTAPGAGSSRRSQACSPGAGGAPRAATESAELRGPAPAGPLPPRPGAHERPPHT